MRIPLVAGHYNPVYLDVLRALGNECLQRWRIDRAVLNVTVERGPWAENLRFRQQLAIMRRN